MCIRDSPPPSLPSPQRRPPHFFARRRGFALRAAGVLCGGPCHDGQRQRHVRAARVARRAHAAVGASAHTVGLPLSPARDPHLFHLFQFGYA
eukprot:4339689-Pleurochrysis_carterae.AAC.2